MEYQSDHYFNTFSNSRQLRHLIGALGVSLIPLIPVGFWFGNNDQGRGILHIIKGLIHTPKTTLSITLLISLILGLLTYFLLKSSYGPRKIIVGLEFKQQEKCLLIRTRDLLDNVNEYNFRFHEINMMKEQLSDGITSELYSCFTLLYKGEILGSYYKSHPMWSISDDVKIISKFESLSKL